MTGFFIFSLTISPLKMLRVLIGMTTQSLPGSTFDYSKKEAFWF